MAAPVLGPFAQGLYGAVAPLAFDDEAQGWALAHLCNAFSQTMEDLEGLIRDDLVYGAPGWSQAVDVNRAPAYLLPWLSQFVGVKLDQGLTESQQRQVIRQEGGFSRGTLQSLVAAVSKYLVGQRTVIVRERYPTPYSLMVITYASDTQVDFFYYQDVYDDESMYTDVYNDYDSYAIPFNLGGGTSHLIEDSLMAQKPAGLVLDYHVLAGQDYAEIWLDWPDYQSVYSHYGDYQALLDDAPRPNPFAFQELLFLADYQELYDEWQAYIDVWANFISY